MPDYQVYLQPCDQVEWDGKNFLMYPEGGPKGYPVQDAAGDHPYIIIPDPKEEAYYEEGCVKGHADREEGRA